jgi:uncharacterized membrane protein
MSQTSQLPRMAAALLALLGLLDATYLSLERLTGGVLACPVGGGCEVVQASAYSVLLGIPVAYIGMAGYAALLVVALRSLHDDYLLNIPVIPLLVGLSTIGVLFSAYLVYLQFFVIYAICFWCMVSATFQLCIWLIALYEWRQERLEAQAAAH